MSSSHPFTAETTLRLSSAHQWPGERNPDRSDVDEANQNPAANFLDRFRAALLHSASGEVDEALDFDPRTLETQMIQATSMEQYTYPMALLARVQTTPSDEELAHLQAVFMNTFKHHILIKDLEFTGFSQNNMPPYLQYACAALAAVFSTDNDPSVSPANDSTTLFNTGVNVWIVTVECDNREARVMDAVFAATLLITHGILSADRGSWKRARGLLCNIVTIVRRLHLTDGYSAIYHASNVMERDISMKSSLLTYMLILDTFQTIHCNSVPNFSVSEFFARMPSSNYAFRKIYDSLVHGHFALPSDVTSREDGLLLLIALLSDIMYTQKCFLPYIRAPRSAAGRNRSFDSGSVPEMVNPYAPLTSLSEYSRLSTMFHHALTRWERHFAAQAGGDIIALYHFTRIQLLCPDLSELPSQAGYLSPHAHLDAGKEIEIPDKAVTIAWQTLDALDTSTDPGDRRLSIWLPIVVFMSALVVWKKLRSPKASVHMAQSGTVKVLSMFGQQLLQYPWPCCADMIAVLDRLARS